MKCEREISEVFIHIVLSQKIFGKTKKNAMLRKKEAVHSHLYTVKSLKFEVLGTRGFILNYQQFELKRGRHKNI